jgi:hypothetical protein
MTSPGSTYDGQNSTYCLKSASLSGSNHFIAQQVLQTCVGFVYYCQFNFYFDAYYATPQNRNTPVPYVHVYAYHEQNNRTTVGVFNLAQGQQRQWQQKTFFFTGSGTDTLEFEAGSPQPRTQGRNFVQVDNIVCFLSEWRGVISGH